jgi:malonyl-CoA O-methyltransferase
VSNSTFDLGSRAPAEGVDAGGRPSPCRISAREGYKLWAATYDADANPLLALEERELEPLVPDPGGRRVLDLGCGTGRWLHKIMSRGPRLALGVDFTAEMAHRAAAHGGLKGRVILADCLLIPLKARAVDLVVCSFTLSHLVDIRFIARELRRASCPSAEVFITDLHPVAQAKGWRCGFRHKAGRVEIETFIHTKSVVQELFESQGFVLMKSLDLQFGEPERPIFASAGHANLFEEACAMPAVILYHFALR